MKLARWATDYQNLWSWRTFDYFCYRCCSWFILVVMMCLYRELFPSSRCLFIYRDVEKVAKSAYRTSLVVPSGYLVMKLLRLSSRLTKKMIDAMGLNGSDFCLDTPVNSDLAFGVVLTVVLMSFYLDSRRRGLEISAVCYEDLVARPLNMCRVILEFCHLPVSLAELAVKAFDIDSQRSSVLAKSVVGCFKEPEMTPQIKTKLNELLKKHGLPLIGEPGIIEGTLTCS